MLYWMWWVSITTDGEEKVEALNAFFTSVFNSQTSHPQGSQPPEMEHKDKEQNNPFPPIQEETVGDLLLHLDCFKFIGPDGIHLRALSKLVESTKLAEVFADALSIIYQQSCSTGEVPDN